MSPSTPSETPATCPNCGRPADNPLRSADDSPYTFRCSDPFHRAIPVQPESEPPVYTELRLVCFEKALREIAAGGTGPWNNVARRALLAATPSTEKDA